MIKTWFIIVPVYLLMIFILLVTNFIILLESELSISYLKQKARLMLAEYCINDFFKCIHEILDNRISCFEGNFSTVKKILENEIENFIERVNRTKDFLRKCGLEIRFEKSIIYHDNEEEYLIEIIAEVHVEDYEEFFSFRRSNKITRSLRKL